MIEKQEFRGYWFLPGKYDSKVAGILTFIPNEKIKLELIGTFDSDVDPISAFMNKKTEMIVHGISSDSKEITLYNCHPSGSVNFSCPFPMVNYTCQYLLVGKLLVDINECSFDKIQVHYPILNEWLYPGLVETQIEMNNNEWSNYSYSFSSNEDKKIKCKTKIDDDFDLIIKSSVSIKENDIRTEMQLNQSTYFEIKSIKRKANISELLQKSGLFKQFISLSSLSTNIVTSIILFDNDHCQEISNGDKVIHPIDFYYVDRTPFHSKQKYDRNFLFTYSQVEMIFPQIIYNWYNDSDNIAPIRGHLIESVREKLQYSSLDFLIIVQALEGFHRRYINNKKVGLKKRLSELKIKFDDIAKIKNIDIDLDDTVDSRDYYSHFFNRIEKPHLLDGIELYNLSKKLRLLLVCCVLHLIGVENETINVLLNHSNSDKLK